MVRQAFDNCYCPVDLFEQNDSSEFMRQCQLRQRQLQICSILNSCGNSEVPPHQEGYLRDPPVHKIGQRRGQLWTGQLFSQAIQNRQICFRGQVPFNSLCLSLRLSAFLMWIALFEVRDHCFLDREVLLNPFQIFVLHLEEPWILCLSYPQKSQFHLKKSYSYTKFLTEQQPPKGGMGALRARSRVSGSKFGLKFGSLNLRFQPVFRLWSVVCSQLVDFLS